MLWAYARDLFQTPGFGDTIDFSQIKRHYYVVHTDLNPTQIVPKGPDLSGWLTPHGREQLGGRPFGDGTPPPPPAPAEIVPAGRAPGRRTRRASGRRADERRIDERSAPFASRRVTTTSVKRRARAANNTQPRETWARYRGDECRGTDR